MTNRRFFIVSAGVAQIAQANLEAEETRVLLSDEDDLLPPPPTQSIFLIETSKEDFERRYDFEPMRQTHPTSSKPTKNRSKVKTNRKKRGKR